MSAILEVEGLTKSFGELVAVGGISFAIQPGECVGMLGPNGAGKTTTLEILEGLQDPTSGTVRLFGKRWAEDPDGIRNRIGIQLQETKFRDRLAAHEVLKLFRSFYPSGMDVDQALALTGLQEKRKAQVGTLSGGQRQRLGLAVSLISDPDIVFLDEPTTGLDPHARRELWEVIEGLRHKGRTILLSTHYMEEAQRLCDRLLVIDRGKLVADGSPKDLIAKLDQSATLELSVAPAITVEELGTVPGVLSVEARGETLELRVQRVHSTLPQLIALLGTKQREITALATRQASLEDVFLKLTGHRLVVEEPPKVEKKPWER